MTDSTIDDLDRQALELLRHREQPRRRARPRVSRALADAEDIAVETPAGEVAAWRLGEGPAVLMVHGWEDDNSLWGPAIEAFQQWGRPIVTMDLPGHGFSPAEDASVTSVSNAVQAVAAALGPVSAIIGHSYGCAAIIHALGHGMAVDKAVLIASPVPRTQPRRPLEFDDVDPDVLRRAEEIRAERGAGLTEKIEASIRQMTAKALVVCSIDDDRTPLSNSQRLAELWPGAELFLADGLGHRFVAQDDDVIARIVDFVEGP